VLTVVPVTFRQASAFVVQHHRHHQPPRGCRFCLGVATEDHLAGVAMVGRPVARHFDDGTANANSALYGAAWRTARALGYRRLITYTQEGESGSSLRAAGWRIVAERPARASWAASSVTLAHLRHPVGAGGVARTLWEVAS